MAKSKKIAIAVPQTVNENVSVSVRKIDNGFILSKCVSTDDDYRHSETFSQDKPSVEAMLTTPSAEPERPDSMAKAIGYLNGSK